MPASLAPGATQGTATQPPRTRKPRKASAFVIMQESEGDAGVGLTGFVKFADATSIKDARAKCKDLRDGTYEIMSRRGRVTVATETSKTVKASK